MSQNYKGLLNSGATCYMNSLLQTLFMNVEFRSAIFQWEYDNQVHVREEDCILYQLQLLFGKLSLDSYTFNVDTQRLTKSFQWNSQMNQEQQDIQEFCRVLFDVIDTTTEGGMINRFFQGNSVNFVQCLKCKHKSERNESFLDLQLTVRNKFDRIYNDSLFKMLQCYLKPEELKGDNQYMCENCQSKQDASKGIALVSLPKYFQIIMNRFEFDYENMKRMKLSDKVSFPFVLNMNDYMNGYDNIKNKQSEEQNQQYFQTMTNSNPEPYNYNPSGSFVTLDKKKSTTSTNSNSVKSLVNKKTVKPNRNTLDFIKEMRKKKSEQQNIDLNDQDEIVVNDTYKPPVEEQLDQIIEKRDKIEQKVNKQEANNKQEPSFQPACNQGEAKKLSICELQSTSKSLRSKYLLEGDQVYLLSSILIHKGGAYGGHYYTYILCDDQWLEFNDNRVGAVQDLDGMIADSLTNGYMFNYSRIDNQRLVVTDIPDYIIKAIDLERQLQQLEKQKVQFAKDVMNVRVYYKMQSHLIPVNKQDTYQYLLLAALNTFNIKESLDNVRLRHYDVINDLLLHTYTNKSNFTLTQLKISVTQQFALEIKKSDEIFCEFCPNKIHLELHSLQGQKIKVQVSLEESLQRVIDKEIGSDRWYGWIRMNQGSKHQMNKVDLDSMIGQLSFQQGQTIYLERHDEQGVWSQQLDKQNNIICIKYNVIAGNEFDQIIEIDGRCTIQDLRLDIMKQVIHKGHIIMRRGNRIGQELKDITSSLQDMNIINYSQIFIEDGQPCLKDQVRILLFKCDPSSLIDDNFFFSFQELGHVVVDIKASAQALKETIKSQFNDIYKEIPLECLQIREKMGERLARVYSHQQEMGKQGVFDRKVLGVQIVNGLEKTNDTKKEVSVWVREASDDYSLGERSQIVLDRTASLDQVAVIFRDKYNMNEIQMTRIMNVCSFNRYGLKQEEWITIQGDQKLTSYPLFIQDGQLLIIKANTCHFQDIDQETAIKHKLPIRVAKTNSNKKYQAPKEKGITILIKTKEQESLPNYKQIEVMATTDKLDANNSDFGPLF